MVNDLGVDPDDWFNDPPRPEEKIADDFISSERVDPPPELMEVPTSVENPKPAPKKEEKNLHHQMYEIATARYNPFSLGGSENCDSDVSCNTLGGSENRLGKSENTN